MKPLVYYIFNFTILLYYGVEVCPYLEQITIPKLAINQALFFIPIFIIQFYLVRNLIDKKPLYKQPRLLFITELTLFLAIGFGLTVFNMIVYGDQLFASTYDAVVSGLKVVLGIAVLGFFSSLDLVLYRERSIIKQIIETGSRIDKQANFFSLPNKFLVITSLGAIFVVCILLLLVVKDFQWLEGNIQSYGVEAALQSVIFEIIFVIIVLFSLGIKLIISYSKNLKLYFSLQTKVLNHVSEGNLNQYVPVINNDEFGIIAHHTNTMIDDLKEKNRIKSMFGKVVSPIIAQRITNQNDNDKGIKMGGGKEELIILFSDIRGFTTLSETFPPEEIVSLLNEYFERMVPIIQNHGGIIDKFIGDGIFAVFGLEQTDKAEAKAVKAALEMQDAVDLLNKEKGFNLAIGIGLHKGNVIAGIIGSSDRLEFTFIGDAVNTTARLEALTKELKAKILVSGDLYRELSTEDKLQWTDYGKQALKGKHKPVSVMGIIR